MSKRILITFGGRAYDAHTALLVERVPRLGVDEVRVFDDRWLMTTNYYKINRWIFDRKPAWGFGWNAWKPFVMQYALRCFATTGDLVMYCDGDVLPLADLTCIFDAADRDGIWLAEEQGCSCRTWIKRECFDAMASEAWDATIAVGRYQIFKAGDFRNEQFLQEWRTYSLNPHCQFHPGSRPGVVDDSSFIRNSCEQSVLSLLAAKYQIPLHRTPDQAGWPVAHDGTYKPDDKYPQLFRQVGARGNVNDLSGSRFGNID